MKNLIVVQLFALDFVTLSIYQWIVNMKICVKSNLPVTAGIKRYRMR